MCCAHPYPALQVLIVVLGCLVWLPCEASTPTSTASVSATLPSMTAAPTASTSRSVTPPPTRSATITTITVPPTPTMSTTITPPPTFTASKSATITPPPTPTVTFTITPAPTPTLTFAPTPTATFSNTLVPTPTATFTTTVTPPPTPTATFTATLLPTPTPTMSATRSATFSNTVMPTSTETTSQTITPPPTATPTATISPPPTPSATVSLTITPPPTKTGSPSATVTPAATASPSHSRTLTPAATPSASATTSASNTASVSAPGSPTRSSSSEKSHTGSLQATWTASTQQTETVSVSRSADPTPTLTKSLSATLGEIDFQISAIAKLPLFPGMNERDLVIVDVAPHFASTADRNELLGAFNASVDCNLFHIVKVSGLAGTAAGIELDVTGYLPVDLRSSVDHCTVKVCATRRRGCALATFRLTVETPVLGIHFSARNASILTNASWLNVDVTSTGSVPAVGLTIAAQVTALVAVSTNISSDQQLCAATSNISSPCRLLEPRLSPRSSVEIFPGLKVPAFYVGNVSVLVTVRAQNTDAVFFAWALVNVQREVVLNQRSGAAAAGQALLDTLRWPAAPALSTVARRTFFERGLIAVTAQTSAFRLVAVITVAFVVLTVVGQVVSWALRSAQIEEAWEAPLWRRVARQHLLLSVAFPCHRNCHAIHTTNLYAGVLAACASGSCLVLYASEWSFAARVSFSAIIAAISAAVPRAALSLLFYAKKRKGFVESASTRSIARRISNQRESRINSVVVLSSSKVYSPTRLSGISVDVFSSHASPERTYDDGFLNLVGSRLSSIVLPPLSSEVDEQNDDEVTGEVFPEMNHRPTREIIEKLRPLDRMAFDDEPRKEEEVSSSSSGDFACIMDDEYSPTNESHLNSVSNPTVGKSASTEVLPTGSQRRAPSPTGSSSSKSSDAEVELPARKVDDGQRNEGVGSAHLSSPLEEFVAFSDDIPLPPVMDYQGQAFASETINEDCEPSHGAPHYRINRHRHAGYALAALLCVALAFTTMSTLEAFADDEAARRSFVVAMVVATAVEFFIVEAASLGLAVLHLWLTDPHEERSLNVEELLSWRHPYDGEPAPLEDTLGEDSPNCTTVQ